MNRSRPAPDLDRLDGRSTTVSWRPDFVWVPKAEIASFVRVRQETAGLMYYERDAYLQSVVQKRAVALRAEDLARWSSSTGTPGSRYAGEDEGRL